MPVLRWMFAALLVWGLFIGIGYAFAPLMTDGRWGNSASTAIGILVIAVCTLGLLKFDPRSR